MGLEMKSRQRRSWSPYFAAPGPRGRGHDAPVWYVFARRSPEASQKSPAKSEWAIQDSNLGPLPYQSHRGMERRGVRGHTEHKIPAIKQKWSIDPRRRWTPGLILMYPSGTSLAGDACVISGDVTTRSLRRPSGSSSMLAPRHWMSSTAGAVRRTVRTPASVPRGA
jgi:hypothetical protein